MKKWLILTGVLFFLNAGSVFALDIKGTWDFYVNYTEFTPDGDIKKTGTLHHTVEMEEHLPNSGDIAGKLFTQSGAYAGPVHGRVLNPSPQYTGHAISFDVLQNSAYITHCTAIVLNDSTMIEGRCSDTNRTSADFTMEKR